MNRKSAAPETVSAVLRLVSLLNIYKQNCKERSLYAINPPFLKEYFMEYRYLIPRQRGLQFIVCGLFNDAFFFAT